MTYVYACPVHLGGGMEEACPDTSRGWGPGCKLGVVCRFVSALSYPLTSRGLGPTQPAAPDCVLSPHKQAQTAGGTIAGCFFLTCVSPSQCPAWGCTLG